MQKLLTFLISIIQIWHLIIPYATSITLNGLGNCCNGFADKVMIVEIEGNVGGYITLNYRDDNVVVGLAAVDERYRGKGCFTVLIESILQMIKDEGKERLYYGTQLANIPV